MPPGGSSVSESAMANTGVIAHTLTGLEPDTDYWLLGHCSYARHMTLAGPMSAGRCDRQPATPTVLRLLPSLSPRKGLATAGTLMTGFSLTPLGEGGSIVYRKRTIDIPVTRDECTSPGNPGTDHIP